MTLNRQYRRNYETLHKAGMQANNNADYQQAHQLWDQAYTLAAEHRDSTKQVNALVPDAKAYSCEHDFETSRLRLDRATEILDADSHHRIDEQASVETAYGRLEAVAVIAQSLPKSREREALATSAVDHFKSARIMLEKHPHRYYRYTNAGHGAVVAAMAGERREASALIAEGGRTALWKSLEPYDQKRTYKINPKQLIQLGAAALLLPFGNRTPKLAAFARAKLIK